ncbi:MAG: aminoacyl-tRNA hydrolase, partial [Candidatus Nealsonbacteria bacterium CG08_land_8_20_14_0_20_43_11]
KTITIIAGLGNPSEEYRKTRHNIGFRTVDEFQKENNFPEFSFSKKFNALISETNQPQGKIILVKPQTFMNNSGTAVGKMACHYKIETKNLFVVHDDIDLPIGKIKIVINRGAAGHKGVESIVKRLSTKSFVRFRIGIAPETWNVKHETINNKNRKVKTEEFVLKKFSKEEKIILESVIKNASKAIRMAIEEGAEKAMNEFNKF